MTVKADDELESALAAYRKSRSARYYGHKLNAASMVWQVFERNPFDRDEYLKQTKKRLVDTIEVMHSAAKILFEALLLSNVEMAIESEDGPKRARREVARAGGLKRAAKDPKQAAKREAYKQWQAWQAGDVLHKSGAAFARFICEKYPVIENPATVERWARLWAAERLEKATQS